MELYISLTWLFKFLLNIHLLQLVHLQTQRFAIARKFSSTSISATLKNCYVCPSHPFNSFSANVPSLYPLETKNAWKFRLTSISATLKLVVKVFLTPLTHFEPIFSFYTLPENIFQRVQKENVHLKWFKNIFLGIPNWWKVIRKKQSFGGAL